MKHTRAITAAVAVVVLAVAVGGADSDSRLVVVPMLDTTPTSVRLIVYSSGENSNLVFDCGAVEGRIVYQARLGVWMEDVAFGVRMGGKQSVEMANVVLAGEDRGTELVEVASITNDGLFVRAKVHTHNFRGTWETYLEECEARRP